MTNLKFEVGKAYKTRDGRKAVFACNLVDYGCTTTSESLVFVVEKSRRMHFSDGRYYANGNGSHHDIISEWHEPVDVVVDVTEWENGDLHARYDKTCAVYPGKVRRAFKAKLTEIVEK